MRKYLELEVVYRTERIVCFRIKKQSHIHFDFGNTERGTSFVSSNRVRLCSSACPEWNTFEEALFVRGIQKEYNNESLQVPTDYFKDIQEAVKEYNRFFRGKILEDEL